MSKATVVVINLTIDGYFHRMSVLADMWTNPSEFAGLQYQINCWIDGTCWCGLCYYARNN